MSGTVVVQVWWKKPWKRWSRRTSMDFFMWMKLEDDPSNDSISQNSIWAHPFHLPGYSAESLQDTPWRRGADPCGEVWVEFLFAKPNGFSYGYGSIPINTIFRGINIHLPAISMFTRGTRFWHTAIYNLYNSFLQWSGHTFFFFRVTPERLENAVPCCVAFVKGPSGISTWDVGIHLQLHDQDGRRQTFSWIAFWQSSGTAYWFWRPQKGRINWWIYMNIYIYVYIYIYISVYICI